MTTTNNPFPELTDIQKQQLSARYGQALTEEQEARDAVNAAQAKFRRASARVRKLATEFADVYQGKLAFPEL